MRKLVLPSIIKQRKDDFIFGVATSSFQIEGDREHRLDCIWDTFCEQHNTIADGSNGDVACDHVNRWQDDIKLINELGVDAYRLSIAWGRVVDEKGIIIDSGIEFYRQLMQALKGSNKKIFITLYHWDLPQYLEDKGGWLSQTTIDAFSNYVDIVCRELGEYADAFITLNEPYCSGYLGYEVGIHAPGKTGVFNGRQANHHLLVAHGRAMQVIRKNCPETPAGIVINIHPGYPLRDTEADKQAASFASDYLFYWYLDPILKGKYPSIIEQLDDNEKPIIQDDDLQIINQHVDFIGLNYYTRSVYQADSKSHYKTVECNDYPKTDMGWEICPSAFTDVLIELHQRYDMPPLYITENGAAMKDKLDGEHVHDDDRINYFQSHIDAVADAMTQGVDIRGYFAWSLMDNFEWALGYSKRFGLTYVDYQSQKRVLKDSALAYQQMLKSRLR